MGALLQVRQEVALDLPGPWIHVRIDIIMMRDGRHTIVDICGGSQTLYKKTLLPPLQESRDLQLCMQPQ